MVFLVVSLLTNPQRGQHTRKWPTPCFSLSGCQAQPSHLDARQKHVNVKLSWEAAHSWRSCPNLKTRKHSRFQVNKTASAQINQPVRMCKQKKHQHRSTNQFEHRKPPDLLHIFTSPLRPLGSAPGPRTWPSAPSGAPGSSPRPQTPPTCYVALGWFQAERGKSSE